MGLHAGQLKKVGPRGYLIVLSKKRKNFSMMLKLGNTLYLTGFFLACLALISWGIGPLILAFYSGPNAAGAYAVWGMLSVPVAVLSFTVGLLCRSALERIAARKAATENSPVRRQSSVASSAVISRTSRLREKRPFRH